MRSSCSSQPCGRSSSSSVSLGVGEGRPIRSARPRSAPVRSAAAPRRRRSRPRWARRRRHRCHGQGTTADRSRAAAPRRRPLRSAPVCGSSPPGPAPAHDGGSSGARWHRRSDSRRRVLPVHPPGRSGSRCSEGSRAGPGAVGPRRAGGRALRPGPRRVSGGARRVRVRRSRGCARGVDLRRCGSVDLRRRRGALGRRWGGPRLFLRRARSRHRCHPRWARGVAALAAHVEQRNPGARLAPHDLAQEPLGLVGVDPLGRVLPQQPVEDRFERATVLQRRRRLGRERGQRRDRRRPRVRRLPSTAA